MDTQTYQDVKLSLEERLTRLEKLLPILPVAPLVSCKSVQRILDCSESFARRLMQEFRAEFGEGGMVQLPIDGSKIPPKRVPAKPFWDWVQNKHIEKV